MSKQGRLESNTDPNTVTVLRKHRPPQVKLHNEAGVNKAKRQGIEVVQEKKFFAGSNRQHRVDKNTAVLDAETEELHHDRVDLSVGRAIMQARQAKEWTQKDLATRISEKIEVVRDYESGKALPSQAILAKMERQLCVKLRGTHIGEPLAPPGAKTAGKAAPAAKK